MWPWEVLLWSSTVYNDETFGESTLACTHPHDVPTSSSQRAQLDMLFGDHGQALSVASGGTESSSIPETSEEQDIFIPPTPSLPRGLRPAHLAKITAAARSTPAPKFWQGGLSVTERMIDVLEGLS